MRSNTNTSPQNFQHIFLVPRFLENLSEWGSLHESGTGWATHAELFFSNLGLTRYIENFYLYLSHMQVLMTVLRQ